MEENFIALIDIFSDFSRSILRITKLRSSKTGNSLYNE